MAAPTAGACAGHPTPTGGTRLIVAHGCRNNQLPKNDSFDTGRSQVLRWACVKGTYQNGDADMPKKPIDRDVGRRLSEVRQHRGISQRELAKTINVKVGTIQGYEHARIGISATRLEQLAHGLQCEPADLIMPPGSPLPRYLSHGRVQRPRRRAAQHQRHARQARSSRWFELGLLFSGVSELATSRSRSWRPGE